MVRDVKLRSDLGFRGMSIFILSSMVKKLFWIIMTIKGERTGSELARKVKMQVT